MPGLIEPNVLLRYGLTAAVLVLGLLLFGLVLRLRKAACSHMDRAEGSAPQAGKRGFGRMPVVLAGVLLLAVAGWLISAIWGVNLAARLGARTGFSLGGVARSALIIIIALAAVEFISYATRVFIGRLGHRKTDLRRIQKLRTVTPLISGLLNAVIMLTAAAMLLAEAGIQVAPLLAGAGIAGIAIGFGAQSLVKDLFTGAFLIIEDIVNHGDTVQIGDVTGVVEEMTLRTIRLRDFDGTLHIFPYGEAQVIHNKTSEFSCFAFELPISYFSDIDQAMKVLDRTAEELKSDKQLASSMLGTLELGGGVDRFTDNGLILKGRIRTLPAQQGSVGAAFLSRAKRRLDEAGIMIGHRHQPVPPFDLLKPEFDIPSPALPQSNGRAS